MTHVVIGDLFVTQCVVVGGLFVIHVVVGGLFVTQCVVVGGLFVTHNAWWCGLFVTHVVVGGLFVTQCMVVGGFIFKQECRTNRFFPTFCLFTNLLLESFLNLAQVM